MPNFEQLFKLTPLSGEATQPLPRGGIEEITFHAQTGNPMKDKINLLWPISPLSTYHSALVSLIDSTEIIIDLLGIIKPLINQVSQQEEDV